MFLCKAPPPAPVFAPDLEKLGFELRDGAFVKKGSSPPEYFDFFHTDDDQTNERRKEAIHEAARAAVASELEKKYDIKQVYIASDGEVATIKPSEAHITLLATEVSKLRTKRDVIIVVGEEAAGKQDAGIWAYRALMNEGGMEKGSAVGLAKMLVEQAKGAAAREDDSKGGSEEDLVTSTAKLSTTDNDDDTMGVVIFNPGQLLYSYSENKSMSQVTWVGRQRDSALDLQYEISEKYNKVPGHRTPHRHLEQAFHNTILDLVNDEAHLYIIAIGDSAEHTIEILDNIWMEKYDFSIAKQIEAIAFIEPQGIDVNKIASASFQSFLRCSAQSWIRATEVPLGQAIEMPNNGHSRITLNSKVSNLEEELERAERADSAKAIEDAGDDEVNSQVSSTAADWGEEQEDEEQANEDNDEIVCPTYSAGDCDGIAELVLPQVMGHVVHYFLQKKKTAEHYEAMNGGDDLDFY
ncbi:hypothetical protein CLAFUW4_14437 [Fulvia fulva]|uniref:Arb2 domain-containing protein n=1 Tax=Passalora fulva TaxID=5499 RepID=A0A9Q8UWS8_PASFU|nr:uncharacterized protein CLAFUR5_14269 [Fulvia fulva]KAK4609851.1 hypothetical protein CLAFUR0_14435 [Fulvia fulva]UJO25328.1 hypothetical protein CLAFUR5_14269 [Fulvia fulva]WPV22712.1 hypothetical protein CLAFUW4_14437 [Fulvia fulva]